MSKVISFRLNPDNSRETEAFIILQDWLSRGFSTRYTITEALLNLNSVNSHTLDSENLNDLSNQIKELLESIGVGSTTKIMSDDILSKQALSDGFVSSIIKAAKPGIKVEA